MPHQAGLIWVKFPTVRILMRVKCPGIAWGGGMGNFGIDWYITVADPDFALRRGPSSYWDIRRRTFETRPVGIFFQEADKMLNPSDANFKGSNNKKLGCQNLPSRHFFIQSFLLFSPK